MKNTLILKTPHKNRRLHFDETNNLNDFTTWVMSIKNQSRRTGWNKLLLGDKNTTIERNKR